MRPAGQGEADQGVPHSPTALFVAGAQGSNAGGKHEGGARRPCRGAHPSHSASGPAQSRRGPGRMKAPVSITTAAPAKGAPEHCLQQAICGVAERKTGRDEVARGKSANEVGLAASLRRNHRAGDDLSVDQLLSAASHAPRLLKHPAPNPQSSICSCPAAGGLRKALASDPARFRQPFGSGELAHSPKARPVA